MQPSSSFPRAGILLVGNELLRGEIPDRNGAFMGGELTSMGFQVERIVTVPDGIEAIACVTRDLHLSHDLLVVMGGLGPTGDDLTTEAIAQALSIPLEFHEESWQRIVMIYASRGRTPPEVNRKQALIPQGAEVLPNPQGTAPGYLFQHEGHWIAVLPGPPRENQAIFGESLKNRLREIFPTAFPRRQRILRIFGLTESQVAERIEELARKSSVEFRYLFRFPEILVLLSAHPSEEKVLDETARKAHALLEPHVYTEGEKTLPEVVGLILKERHLKVVAVESCTGGLGAKLLTDIPGSSAWFERGFVVYTNDAKEEVLGVPKEILQEFGAVSEETALAMLKGGLEHSRADVGFAITGVAGPTGGTREKPVGTVCIAVGDRKRGKVKTYHFSWDREYNRLISVWTALHRLRLWILSSM
jgi:nicotinamide-nucleotide amidase